MLTLSEIWIYPVKSLGGIRVDCAKVLGKGLEYDRRYMLVDENHQFMTQRFMPEMARFKLAFGVDNFRISHNEDTLEIPKSFEGKGGGGNYSIWSDRIQGFELGEKFNAWFSEKLNLKCKLIYFPEDSARMVDQNYAVGGEQVSLADGYPFLIIGQSSVDDLNRRLDEAVPMNRFRPNFVFKGGAPYEEDSWRNFKIGANRFTGVKQCARCVLTTVNQETATTGVEPLATLATYRRTGSKVNFGQNLIAVDQNEVQEGDEITIQSFQELVNKIENENHE